MPDTDSVTRRVKEAIIESLALPVTADEIADDEVLFGGGMALDSIASLEIIAAIEREFGLEVADEDLTAELFDSVATLTEYVVSRLEAMAPGVPGSPDAGHTQGPNEKTCP